MKFKDLITNLMGSTIFMVILFYLFVEWFFGMATGEINFSHTIDIVIYPFIALLWMFALNGSPLTKFVIWSNRVMFPLLIILAVVFFRTMSEGEYMIYDNKEIAEVTEVNTKYIIQMSDTTTYYADKNDTITYNVDNWKLYQFVREDMFNDTLFGSLYFGNGEDFLHLKYIQ